MRSVLLAFGITGGFVACLFGCSLLVSTDDLTAESRPPAEGGTNGDASALDDSAATDGDGDGDGHVLEAGEAGGRFCTRAAHVFCEDFDDPSFVFPGRWRVVEKAGGTAVPSTTDFVSSPRAMSFTVPNSSGNAAAGLDLDTNIVTGQGVFALDAKFEAAPNDNYNFCDVTFPAATGSSSWTLNLLVTPKDLHYFEQSGSFFREWVFRPSVPAGWHHYALTFDLVAHTSSIAYDGVMSAVNTIDTGFVPGKVSLGVGIGFARAGAGPTTVLVDNVTLDVP